MTEIYIIRHGESSSNIGRTFTGQIDAELSELGRAQAERVAKYFEKINVDAVFSSDLTRAVQTAQPFADSKGLEIVTSPELREINAGLWQGLPFTDIEKRFPDTYRVWRSDIGSSRCDGGESVADLAKRVYSYILKTAKENEGKSVAIFTHATPVRSFLSLVTQGDLHKMSDINWVKNASVSKFLFENDSFSVEFTSDVSHLDGMVSGLPSNV